MSEATKDTDEPSSASTSPGDAKGVPVPHEQAAPGTSEASSAIEGDDPDLEPDDANRGGRSF